MLLLIFHENRSFGIDGDLVAVRVFIISELHDNRIGLDPLEVDTGLGIIDKDFQFNGRVLLWVQRIGISMVRVDSKTHLNILRRVSLSLKHSHTSIDDKGTIRIIDTLMTLRYIIHILSLCIVARLTHT